MPPRWCRSGVWIGVQQNRTETVHIRFTDETLYASGAFLVDGVLLNDPPQYHMHATSPIDVTLTGFTVQWPKGKLDDEARCKRTFYEQLERLVPWPLFGVPVSPGPVESWLDGLTGRDLRTVHTYVEQLAELGDDDRLIIDAVQRDLGRIVTRRPFVEDERSAPAADESAR